MKLLTPRETEVLRLITEGSSNPDVAGRLHVSDETVKTHVSRVLAKLGLRDRTQAVVTAYESELVVPRAGGGLRGTQGSRWPSAPGNSPRTSGSASTLPRNTSANANRSAAPAEGNAHP
ncbi:response regulator protein VraR [Streptomyces jeddahensis]|uniref:Response regulator protein VraR n=1 Tax=Streptomyces jeddahensis TaxID=1716141 RepID=A0A177HKW8_9ACTN|nr:response regulator protein VraR [Streptomyces jeddahensis]